MLAKAWEKIEGFLSFFLTSFHLKKVNFVYKCQNQMKLFLLKCWTFLDFVVFCTLFVTQKTTKKT